MCVKKGGGVPLGTQGRDWNLQLCPGGILRSCQPPPTHLSMYREGAHLGFPRGLSRTPLPHPTPPYPRLGHHRDCPCSTQGTPSGRGRREGGGGSRGQRSQ